jgi:UrcA family protein
MKTTLSIGHTVPFAALALAALVMAPNSAFAQQASEDQALEAVEEIVKVEVLVTSRFEGRPNELGARTEVFEVRRAVSFADLDLRLAADVDELDRRIESTAQEACETLEERHPLPMWRKGDRQRCIREAIESTDQELETIFAGM